MTDLLLEATGVAKHYGAVAALRDASLAVRPGEVHALLGANGAGKSTLVKILTGAVRPDAGTIVSAGRRARPFARRRATYRDRLRLPGAGARARPRRRREPRADRDAGRALPRRGSPTSGIPARPAAYARDLPLPTLRVLDLARALAVEPDVLLLDEMTAALPADLTERVLEVIGGHRGRGGRSIFISHRMLEIAALCDRATVLRDGETVGVVDIVPRRRGADRQAHARPGGRRRGGRGRAPRRPSRAGRRRGRAAPLGARPGAGAKLQDVSFELRAGEVLGVVALEGQGQDELFEMLAGWRRPDGGELSVDGAPVRFGHPADAIRAGSSMSRRTA